MQKKFSGQNAADGDIQMHVGNSGKKNVFCILAQYPLHCKYIQFSYIYRNYLRKDIKLNLNCLPTGLLVLTSALTFRRV